jgi:glycerol-3-phosphate cytidylyltransferase
MIKIITYGTFDLFHVGHVRLLKRLFELGDQVVVGCSTDEFNEIKGKKTVVSFSERCEILMSCKYVHSVFAENSWDQKIDDIKRENANIFAIGDDWKGKFDFLREYCDVIYLPRTMDISSTILKYRAKSLSN